MRVQSLGREDPLEEGMATHSSSLAWRIPWTEEPGGHSPGGREESAMTERAHSLADPWETQVPLADLLLLVTRPCGPGKGT